MSARQKGKWRRKSGRMLYNTTKPEKIGNCESRKQERVTILVREKIMGTMH